MKDKPKNDELEMVEAIRDGKTDEAKRILRRILRDKTIRRTEEVLA